jgi:tetratricopeptide (TPR) repeat protein
MALGPERRERRRPVARDASLRLPASAPRHEGPPGPPTDRPSLRLAVARGALSIELDAPWQVGPLGVEALVAALAGVRFPVDLSGGVARFRHRRGALVRVALEARSAELGRWLAPRLRGVLGDATPDVVVAPHDAGLLVGLRAGSAALAFDVVIAPVEGELRFVPDRARGLGLGGPPHVLALRALAAVLRGEGRVVAGAVVVADAAGRIAREVLPAAGARAPSTAGVRWEAPRAEVGKIVLSAEVGASPPALGDRAIGALELGELVGDADEAAWAGDFDRARRGYLGALERAPRHPEIARRLAWLDASVGQRAEGALSTIVEIGSATDAGLLGGELLEAVGDGEGAVAAFARGAVDEPFGPLAALAWLRVATLSSEPAARFDALDHAVARAPSLDVARWARLEARLDAGDARGARADADHLEAAASGAHARHAVWRRVADAMLDRGFVPDATAAFERSLRYAPESPEAVAGLARALRAAGQDRRALDVLARAAALAARSGGDAGAIEIDLARGLAEIAGDRPAAIARVRAVPPGRAESFDARALEGRWRAEIGDLAGAAIAFGRLADAVEAAPALAGDAAAHVATLLCEAATVEELEREDLVAAERHLGLALRLRPRDRAIGASFRRVAAAARARARLAPDPRRAPLPALVEDAPASDVDRGAAEPALPSSVPPSAPPGDAPIASISFEAPEELGGADDEAEVQRLTERLRADPSDEATADALGDLLERLGRDLDLLSLLSARLEEGDDEVRERVGPRRRAVLLRLAAAARAGGRASEAELYELMAST